MQNDILLEADLPLDITSNAGSFDNNGAVNEDSSTYDSNNDSFDYNWTVNEDSSTYDSNDDEDDSQNEYLEVEYEYEPLLDEPDEDLEDHEISLRLLRFFVEFERLPHSTSRIYGGLGPEYDGQDPQPEWLNNPLFD
jgi:hypothetical protein